MWLNAKEVEDSFGVQVNWLRSRVGKGEITVIRVGGYLYFDEYEIALILERESQEALRQLADAFGAEND